MSTPSHAERIDALLRDVAVLPVIRIDHIDQAEPLADALLAGGLKVLEITLRTEAGLKAIEKLAAREDLIVGAGTVTSGRQLREVANAGARFAVSPGATDALYQVASTLPDCPLLAGVASASDVMMGLQHGIERFKFFPAEAAGGTAMLKSLAGPFGQVRFIPTGGIGPHNVADYRALDNVVTVGGSWMLPNDALKQSDWARVSELARECRIG